MPKYNVYKMYQEALGFLAASNYLRYEISRNGTNLLPGAPALTVNQSFACELLLKSLYVINGLDYEKRHKLKDLYYGLPKETIEALKQRYHIKCEEELTKNNNLQLRKIDECLEDYDNAFVDWRYYFENKSKSLCVSWVDFEILTDVLRNTVKDNLSIEYKKC